MGTKACLASRDVESRCWGFRLTGDYSVLSVHAEKLNDHECTQYKLSAEKFMEFSL